MFSHHYAGMCSAFPSGQAAAAGISVNIGSAKGVPVQLKATETDRAITHAVPGPAGAQRESLTASATMSRPHVRGKFLYIGDEKFYIRGVTYGTFRPDDAGDQYPSPETVERDFAAMAANGINAVRTYTVPPRWLLDSAQRHNLRVMVGLPWEQHIAFLDDPKTAASIETRVRTGVRSCAGHPAVLCYTLGNEIPATIVRWYGHRRVERFLERLYRAVKAEDPGGLVTYVNFPPTEYLHLPFLDFASFNVYLERQDRLEAYLARLQNLASDRPLLMAEIGLDSRRNGLDAQADTLDWQVRTVFAAGCAGAFVYAWTDEWYRGGFAIEDWDFGLTDRERHPKPALTAVGRVFAAAPFPADTPWPRISVVVCSYNGARTIREACEGLARLDYPDYEVIVVDDGSTDRTATIAREYFMRVISTANQGLSNARNTGLAAATGELVAYLDDDAVPDPHWLQYLAALFMSTEYVGVGGPNIAPPGDGTIAACVDNAPGNPVHVLISDREAEHIPGCNMAFRKAALEAIDGFDGQCRVAGDDVDVCWRLQARGWKLGYSPAAMVWHHRRNRVRTYWRQQKGYGKAEALLERKWPDKYNKIGHVPWSGRIYGKGLAQALGWRQRRIYHGTWGSALFQSVYAPARDGLWSLPLMPEWYLVIGILAVLVVCGLLWLPLLALSLPLLILSAGMLIAQAILGAKRASFAAPSGRQRYLRMMVAYLHLIQPLARLYGRMRHDLTPWRRRPTPGRAFPTPRTSTIWSEGWRDPNTWLESVEHRSTPVARGGDYDCWDLEIHGGLLGSVRLRMAVEEHGAGTQLLRFRIWPHYSRAGIVFTILFVALATLAMRDGGWFGAALLSAVAIVLVVRALLDLSSATATALRAVAEAGAEVSSA